MKVLENSKNYQRQYRLIYKEITKALEGFAVNTVLDDLDESKQAKKVERMAIKELVKQMTISEALIERAMQLTSKAKNNPQIARLLEPELEEYSDEFEEELNTLLETSANAGGQAAINRLTEEDIKFDLKDKSFVGNRVKLVLASMLGTSALFLSRKIEEARSNLLTIPETKQFIGEAVTKSAKSRAETLVKTEVANMTGTTEYEVFKRAGTVQLKWVTVMDERVCPVCSPLEGKVVSTGSSFVSSNKGETAQHPPIHARCRCFLEPIIVADINLNNLWIGK